VVPTLQLIGPGAILPDDNARPHRAIVANNFVQAAQINRMDWPPNSPDLNPIEHVWDELDRRARSNHPIPANANQLLQMLQAEWQALPQAFFTKLINFMRTRCADCLNNCGYTRY
jgi:transposase